VKGILEQDSNVRQPTGWIRHSSYEPSDLHLCIVAEGSQVSSRINFRIPKATLERLLYGEVKACPVFDERRDPG
jgi:hypothetical protein